MHLCSVCNVRHLKCEDVDCCVWLYEEENNVV